MFLGHSEFMNYWLDRLKIKSTTREHKSHTHKSMYRVPAPDWFSMKPGAGMVSTVRLRVVSGLA